MSAKKILWVGDAVVSSGFSRCTHTVCNALHAAGYEVHLLGMNYYGDPHQYTYPIYPAYHPLEGGHDPFGAGRIACLTAQIKPDLIVLLNDPWNVQPYLDELSRLPVDSRPPVIAWLAVDGKNQQVEHLNQLAGVAVWTQFAATELALGGYTGECSIIPLGVDLEQFQPTDKLAARRRVLSRVFDTLKLSENCFIVGVVGRNQYRKRLDLAIQYFAEWIDMNSPKLEDALLYLHVGPTGDTGVDIKSLCNYYGIGNRVVTSSPGVGIGYANSLLCDLYNSFDVLLSTSQGEGWNLPALEAMACGVPCILPDWAGPADWADGVATLVPCGSKTLTAPVNDRLYTIGAVPDALATKWALSNYYRATPDLTEERSSKSLRLAQSLPWSNTATLFMRLIESHIGPAREVACVDLTEALVG